MTTVEAELEDDGNGEAGEGDCEEDEEEEVEEDNGGRDVEAKLDKDVSISAEELLVGVGESKQEGTLATVDVTLEDTEEAPQAEDVTSAPHSLPTVRFLSSSLLLPFTSSCSFFKGSRLPPRKDFTGP